MKFFVTRNPIVQLKFNFDDSYERYSLLNFGTFLLRKQIKKKQAAALYGGKAQNASSACPNAGDVIWAD
jgi:hypothetical protein